MGASLVRFQIFGVLLNLLHVNLLKIIFNLCFTNSAFRHRIVCEKRDLEGLKSVFEDPGLFLSDPDFFLWIRIQFIRVMQNNTIADGYTVKSYSYIKILL